VPKQNIKHGSIVHVSDCPDPDGKPAGPHFAIVLNSQKSIDAGDELLLAVITTSFSRPLQDGWFLLTDYTPGKPGAHEKTGLTELSVVKGTWLVILARKKVKHKGKRAPAAIVRQLHGWIERLRSESAGS
jgi:hypothetical protein